MAWASVSMGTSCVLESAYASQLKRREAGTDRSIRTDVSRLRNAHAACIATRAMLSVSAVRLAAGEADNLRKAAV